MDPNSPDSIIGTEDDNLQLSWDSPCIDVGDNTAVPPDTADLNNDGNTTEQTPWDLDGRPRFVDDDCDVDLVAFAILASYRLQGDTLVDIAPPPAGNGIVDKWDLAVLCDNWLAGLE